MTKIWMFIVAAVLLGISLLYAQWESDLRLTFDDSTSYLNRAQPVAVNGRYVHVVWRDNRDGNYEIYYKRSNNNGLVWEPDTRLTMYDGFNSLYPAVAVSGSNVYVVWIDSRDGNPEIYYKCSTDNGLTWGSDTRLTYESSSTLFPTVAISGSNIHVAWRDERDGNPEIYYKLSTDGGTTWGSDINLSNNADFSDFPYIAVSGSNVHVVWHNIFPPGGREIYYKCSTDGGTTWGSDAILSDATNATYPSVAVSGSNVHVAWLNDWANLEIYYARSTDNGETWDTTALTNTASVPYYPCIAVSDSNIHVVWDDYDVLPGGNREIYYKVSTDNGITWAPDTQLTYDDSVSYLPSIVVSGSKLHVLWNDNRDGNYEIYYKRNPTGNPGNIFPFNLISPSDSSMLSTTRPTFIWEPAIAASGIKDYEVYIDDTLRANILDTIWTADYDLTEGYHNWYAVACDSADYSVQSDQIWTFGIDITLPSQVTLISPMNGVYLNNNTVNFIWHKATDNFGIDHYLFQYALDSGFSIGLGETTLVDTSFMTTLPDTTYYWRVRAVDIANNTGDWSAVWSFTVDTQSPEGPILLQPIGGIYLSDTLVNFQWSQVSFTPLENAPLTRTGMTEYTSVFIQNALRSETGSLTRLTKIPNRSAPVRYIIELDTLNSFVSPFVVDTLNTTNAILMLQERFPYFWRVRAFDLAGNQGPYADPDSFGLDITPPLVESTTVWTDTSYSGPFFVYTKVTDNVDIDTVLLYSKRTEDPGWSATEMMAGGNNWYYGEIPQASLQNDTVKYYIYARDIAQPANEATDPSGAPTNYYSFIANLLGIKESFTKPDRFSFSVNSPAKEKTLFQFSLPEDNKISLKIYDIVGRLIAVPVSGKYTLGFYKIPFKPESKGIYFYRLKTPYKKGTGKFVVF